MEASTENGDQADTVLSSGNELTYQLGNVVTVDSWEEMQTTPPHPKLQSCWLRSEECSKSVTFWYTAMDRPKAAVVMCMTICDHNTAAAALADLIDTDKDTCRTDTALSQMLVPNLYGGLDIKRGCLTDNDRTRLPMETYFTEGDIILTRYDTATEAFVYLGGSRIAKFNGGSCNILTSGGDAFSGTNFFTTLIAYDAYAVIRPGMAVDTGV